jgi:hypothetical protein
MTTADTRDANVRDFHDLTRQRFDLDNQIGKLAAAIVLDKLNQYGLDEIDLDDENETPSYAMLPDGAEVPTDTGWDDQDELLDEAVGWLPRMAIYNVRGRGGEPPKARREDLEKLLRGEAL